MSKSIIRCELWLALVVALPLGAQERSRLSVEASVGGGYGRGGKTYRNRKVLAADALLGWRVRPVRGGAVLVSVGGGWQGSIGGGDDCLIGPTGGCVPDFPGVSAVVALAGWEGGRSRGASVRVLGGPGYYQGQGARTLGVQARLELATPAPFHVALVGFARGDLLPRLRGETYALGAVGLGVRLQ